jgi:hypothetical protein
MADWTMFKDPVTTICAIIGAGLGVFNFIQGWQQRRVRLSVIPRMFSIERGAFKYSTNELLPRGIPCIEVVNLSGFPITIKDVGFTVEGSTGRMALLDPKLPQRLDSRASFIFHAKDGVRIPWNIRKAYATTECGETRYGDSPVLKQFRESKP